MFKNIFLNRLFVLHQFLFLISEKRLTEKSNIKFKPAIMHNNSFIFL